MLTGGADESASALQTHIMMVAVLCRGVRGKCSWQRMDVSPVAVASGGESDSAGVGQQGMSLGGGLGAESTQGQTHGCKG